MFIPSLLALGSIALVAAQTRNSAFVGCTNDVAGTRFANSLATDALDCAARCTAAIPAGTTTAYSFFQAVNAGCLCHTAFPATTAVQSSSSTDNQDICASNAALSVYRLATTYFFDTCYTNLQGGSETFETYPDISSCFASCGSRPESTRTIVAPIENGFQCSCRTTDTSFTGPQACGRFAGRAGFFVYERSSTSASQGLTKRRKAAARRKEMRERRALAISNGAEAAEFVMEKQDFCPGDLTPCKIFGSKDGYECIDTSSELESCGGCVFGAFGGVQAPEGVNCAADSSLDTMTCRKGQCVPLL